MLQAIDTGEMITIVDERDPNAGPLTNPRAMAKRIFTWGQGRRQPPEGSPLPPHLQIESGVVIKNEMPKPVDAIPEAGPVIVNRENEGFIKIVQEGPTVKRQPGPLARLFGKKEVVEQRPADPQVVEFQKPLVAMNSKPIVVQPAPIVETPVQPALIQPILCSSSKPLP